MSRLVKRINLVNAYWTNELSRHKITCKKCDPANDEYCAYGKTIISDWERAKRAVVNPMRFRGKT